MLPETFEATLNGAPFGGFTPISGTRAIVTISPLSAGRNILKLKTDGKFVGRTSTDRDRLVFIVP